jgi:hypothetical protein
MGAGWSDQRIETIVGTLLRAGVLIAAVVGLIGGAGYLLHHGHDAPRYHVFTGETAEYRSVTEATDLADRIKVARPAGAP